MAMLKNGDQGKIVATLLKRQSSAFLHFRPYGQGTGLQPHAELSNRYLMQ
jgi:hypothetical protein